MKDVTYQGLQERVEVLERELHTSKIFLREVLSLVEKRIEIDDPLLYSLIADDSLIAKARNFLKGTDHEQH